MQSGRVDPLGDEVRLDSIGTLLRQRQVVAWIADVIGVSLDFQAHRRHFRECSHRLIEHRERAGHQIRLVGQELNAFDLLIDKACQARRDFVGAAVLILVVVDCFGLLRALVESIDDAIAVAVDIGAALVDLWADFRRTLVQAIDDAIAVGIDIGAATVFRRASLLRTLVEPIDDAVSVAITIGAAAIFRRAFVAGTAIFFVGHAVLVDVERLGWLGGLVAAVAESSVDAAEGFVVGREAGRPNLGNQHNASVEAQADPAIQIEAHTSTGMEGCKHLAAQGQAGIGSDADRATTGEDERLEAIISAKRPAEHQVSASGVDENLRWFFGKLRRHCDELTFEKEVSAEPVSDARTECCAVTEIAARCGVVAATDGCRRRKEVRSDDERDFKRSICDGHRGSGRRLGCFGLGGLLLFGPDQAFRRSSEETDCHRRNRCLLPQRKLPACPNPKSSLRRTSLHVRKLRTRPMKVGAS